MKTSHNCFRYFVLQYFESWIPAEDQLAEKGFHTKSLHSLYAQVKLRNSAESRSLKLPSGIKSDIKRFKSVENDAYAFGRPTAIGHPAHALRWAIMVISPESNQNDEMVYPTSITCEAGLGEARSLTQLLPGRYKSK